MRTVIVAGDGAGGALLAFQCAHYAEQFGDKVRMFYAIDDAEKFKPIKYFFPDTIQIPEYYQYDNFDGQLDSRYGRYDNLYIIKPNDLFLGKYSFDYTKYNTRPTAIKSRRLLEYRWKPENIIYCALSSSTANYSYGQVHELLNLLGSRLPNKIIYMPKITKWANIDINYEKLDNLPSNVVIEENPDFIDSLKILERSEYCICLDNGISHFSFNLGIPRLLLDFRLNQPGFVARWREDLSESIPITTSPQEIVDIVDLNINLMPTTTIDRKFFIGQRKDRKFWTNALYLK